MTEVMAQETSGTVVALSRSIPVNVSAYVGKSGSAARGEIKHVSSRSVILEAAYPHAAKTLIQLHLNASFSVPAFVQQVQRLAGRRWELRCVFTRELRDDEFAEVLSELFRIA